MKKNVYIFLAVFVTLYFLFIHNGIISIGNSAGDPYTPSDEEVTYLASVNTYRGEGLYKGFSIVYPPGRFLAQSAIFIILSPSVPAARLYSNLAPLFFLLFFFYLSYKIFSKLSPRTLINYVLASIATFGYFFFISSAQEAHALAALFFILLLSDFKSNSLKNYVLGAALGGVFLFRIDTGVLLVISLMVFKIINLREIKAWLLGFALIWVPVLLYIVSTGSLWNFFYDVFYIGLVVQPKTMGLPIPPPPVGLIFRALLIFLLSSAISLSTESNKLKPKERYAIQGFALFSLLSFSAALSRSDEGHLWYGAVWGGFYIAYVVYRLLDFKNLLKHIRLVVIPLAVTLFTIGLFLVKFKNPFLFVLLSVIILWFTSRLKQGASTVILIAGLIAALISFHSVSFLKLRFQRPTVTFKTPALGNLFESDLSEIAGLKFSEKNLAVLKKIDSRLGKKNKWLFIYPDSVIYYEYFHLKNPTRQYYHTGETTDRLQKEAISDIERTRTNNFIVFPSRVNKKRKVWQWIQKYTYVDSTFMLDSLKVEVRKTKVL